MTSARILAHLHRKGKDQTPRAAAFTEVMTSHTQNKVTNIGLMLGNDRELHVCHQTWVASIRSLIQQRTVP